LKNDEVTSNRDKLANGVYKLKEANEKIDSLKE